jgi:predicted PurR-regulated permease PerM
VIFGSIVLVVAALYFAKFILIPVVLAILLSFVLAPAVSALQRLHVWRVPASLVVVVLACALVAGVGYALLAQATDLAQELPKHKQQILEKIRELRDTSQAPWLDKLSDTVNDITKEVQGTPAGTGAPREPLPVKLESSPLIFLPSVFGSALEMLVSVGFVVVLVTFMLIQREDLRNRLIRLWGKGSLTRMTKAYDDAAQRISRFLLVQLFVNASFGVAVTAGLLLIGVPYAPLWGVLGALLRYVPYIGAWLAALLPLAASFIFLDGWTQPLLVLGLYAALELTLSNAIEPWLYGHSIGVSAVALLVATAFWTWLWGPIGLILATPLTACLAVLGRYIPTLEFLRILLGDQPALEPHVTYYQRLLARDQDEAADLVEEYLKKYPAPEACDRILLPALVMTKHSREHGSFSAEDERFILSGTREILDEFIAPSQQVRRIASGQALPPTDGEREGKQALVFGYPAQDAVDETALVILGALLDPARCRLEVLSTELLSGELIAKIEREHPALVCVAVLPPRGLTHTRYLCKRLRNQFPELKIVVGCLGLEHNADQTRQRLIAAGAQSVGTTFEETAAQILGLVQVAPTPRPGKPVAV